MSTLDIIILVIYLLLLQTAGFLAGRNQKSEKDFFTGSGKISWIAICMSIVATETSSLTILSIPGIAYNGDMRFIQVALGYIVGRFLIAFFILPAYFQGNLETVYEFLEHRFSVKLRKFAAILFQITRILGDSVRLFATAIPLTLLLGWPIQYSILLFMALTLPYSLYGGLRSVVWGDVVQLAVYVLGAVGTLLYLQETGISLNSLPMDKKIFFLSGLDSHPLFFEEPLHIFAGLIGGAMLTVSTHGTDQLIVQRTLACGNLPNAKKAIITSGFIVAGQFTLFLVLGLYLYVFYQGAKFKSGDQVFSSFIVSHLPAGMKGLMLAAIFAAAQSTLSSTLNSLASSALFDLFPNLRGKNGNPSLIFSRMLTLIGAVALTLVALLFNDPSAPVVVIALKIASLLAGGITGVYIIGFLRWKEFSAWAGLIVSFTGMFFTIRYTNLAWTWYVTAGFLYCMIVATIVQFIMMLVNNETKRNS